MENDSLEEMGKTYPIFEPAEPVKTKIANRIETQSRSYDYPPSYPSDLSGCVGCLGSLFGIVVAWLALVFVIIYFIGILSRFVIR